MQVYIQFLTELSRLANNNPQGGTDKESHFK